MSEEHPDFILKSALEKIVYFEARSSQLQNDLQSSRTEAQQLRMDLAHASQREIELRRSVAELEVRATRAHAEKEELARRVDALRTERHELISKVLDASRIHSAGTNDFDGFDLASFIAQLRSEVMEAQGAEPIAPPAPPVPTAEGVRIHASEMHRVAAELHAQGRLNVSSENLRNLSNEKRPGHLSEETLFGFSIRELSAPDATARMRAAERLVSLGHTAAAPSLATALHHEMDPKVTVVFLQAFAQFAGKESAGVVEPLLVSRFSDVRLAALKALLKLDVEQAGPHLAAAMKDPDASIRRRASLLALGLSGEQALKLGIEALRDTDAEVRSLGALVLGASGVIEAKALLTQAMRDSAPKVRQAAAQSLSRLFGHDVTSVADLDDVQRRREVRRMHHPESVAASPPQAPKMVQPAQALQPQKGKQLAGTLTLERLNVLKTAVMTELRAAIRGQQLTQLIEATQANTAETQAAVSALQKEGRIVQRGLKYFVA